MITRQGRIGDLWCRLRHDEPMWPAHGQYECRICGRRFQISWEPPPTVLPKLMTWHPETQPQVSAIAVRS
jgi:hypothetical protein